MHDDRSEATPDQFEDLEGWGTAGSDSDRPSVPPPILRTPPGELTTPTTGSDAGPQRGADAAPPPDTTDPPPGSRPKPVPPARPEGRAASAPATASAEAEAEAEAQAGAEAEAEAQAQAEAQAGAEAEAEAQAGAGAEAQAQAEAQAEAEADAEADRSPAADDVPRDALWARGRRRTGPLCELIADLDSALTDLVGPEGLDDDSLGEAVADLVRFRSRLDAVTSGFVGRWDARAVWGSDGSKAAGARLSRDAGCARATAGGTVRLARQARNMPMVQEAWSQGRISSDHVRRLGNARTPAREQQFAEVEGHLVTVAETADWVTFERAVAMFESAADDQRTDPTDPEDLADRDRRERAHRNPRITHVGRRFELGGSLDEVGGEEFRTAWDRIVQEMWEADVAEARNRVGPGASSGDIRRSAGERRADALVEMGRRASSTPADAEPPRPLITAVVSLGELTGPIRETFNGIILSRLDVARLLTEADFERIIFGPDGQPVEVSSPHRFFTGAWRRAVEVRDRTCQHPTCDVPAERCQVDHIVEACDGGPTSVANGRLLCPAHNRQRPGRSSGGAQASEHGHDPDERDDRDDPVQEAHLSDDPDGREDPGQDDHPQDDPRQDDHPQDGHLHDDHLQDAADDREDPGRDDHRQDHRDGSTRTAITEGTPHQDDPGQP